MTEHMEALGLRWAALGLEWMPGMMAQRGWRNPNARWAPILVTDGGRYLVCGVGLGATIDGGGHYDGPTEGMFPDFTDKLTELALLHYVQQAWADPRAYVLPLAGLHTDGRWAVVGNPPPGVLERMAADGYPTWAEACIAALEAAKEVTT